MLPSVQVRSAPRRSHHVTPAGHHLLTPPHVSLPCGVRACLSQSRLPTAPEGSHWNINRTARLVPLGSPGDFPVLIAQSPDSLLWPMNWQVRRPPPSPASRVLTLRPPHRLPTPTSLGLSLRPVHLLLRGCHSDPLLVTEASARLSPPLDFSNASSSEAPPAAALAKRLPLTCLSSPQPCFSFLLFCSSPQIISFDQSSSP